MSALVRRVLEAARAGLGQVPEFDLRAGASDALLAAVEAEIGYALPRDVRELYLAHDGQEADGVGFFFGWRFDPLAVALANWRIERDAYGHRRADWCRRVGEEGGTGILVRRRVRESISSPRWFPLCSLSGHTGIYADSDPADDGIEGQIVIAGNEVLEPDAYADSLAGFLASMEHAIRRGSVTVGRDADGRATWGIGPAAASIDEYRDLFVASGRDWLARIDSACA